MKPSFRFIPYTLFVSCIAAIGGILFGYNTSVISGVLLFVTREFHLTVFEQELVVSTLLIGALLGALIGGFVADRFGRKKTLFFTLFLFFVGVVSLTEAAGFSGLLVGRFISGLAIGIVSMAVPLYIAEMSPPENRGTLVSLNQLCITLGILLAYIVSYFYSTQGEWREMFGFALIPIVVQFLGLFLIPETPAWLSSHHKKARAEKILQRIMKTPPEEPFSKEEGPTQKGWRQLFQPAVKKPFLIGIGIAVFQSITGINTVIYYAPQIFQLAGYQTAQTALFATLLVGVVNVAVTVVALGLIDRVGRRSLLVVGLMGMILSLVGLGISFLIQGADAGLAAIVSMLGFVGCFAFSLGPVAWLLISEIYPLGIRGRAVGIAVFSNWVSNYFVSLTFLSLIQTLGTVATFWLYAIICLFALWFVIRFVPETKGKTFEQIQTFWKKP